MMPKLTRPIELSYEKSHRVFRYGLMLIIFLLFSVLLKATDFPVTNTFDSGPGSFRQAITDANTAGAGPHRIVFNVYGQINLLSSLPAITRSNLTIDGENRITLTNTAGANPIINPFDINANNVTIRNFILSNNGDVNITIRTNTSDVVVEHIRSSSTVGNFLNAMVLVWGNTTNLTLRDISSTDVEPCGGAAIGRAIYFAGGMHTNLVMDSINLRTQGNTRGCEGIVFRDASLNGWTFTNSNISGFQNAIVLDNTGGPVETANNVLLRNVTVDSLWGGGSLGFYSDFVNTNIQLKNVMIDLDVVGSANDGDYSIRFDNTTNGIILDTVTSKDADLYSIWFNGAAQNISINHSRVSDPTPGDGYVGQFVRFEGTANTVTVKNTILDADKLNTTDDVDYGLLFVGATNGVTLDSLTVNEFDVDGIYIIAANTNFQLTNSKITNNLDGIEFYYAVPRTNVDIINSSFSGNTRSGILVNAGHATSDIDLTGDTVFNNASHGIWIYGGTPATDITISGCVIHDNRGAGIYNDDPDKVIYTNNSIYNNTGLGIDNILGNCSYQGVNRPVLVSSTSLGGGQYQLVINLPALVPTGYTVDIYANDPATSASSGQYFVTSITGLSSGNNTRTITYNTGPGATGVGFWTATLRIPANNCGTSEFSDKLNIGSKAPACITNGILAWYRADMGVNGMVWGDISGNGNNMTVVGDPDDTTGLVNFNKAFYYDGNDAHLAPATAGVANAYTIMGMARLEGTQNGRVFNSATGNKLLGWHAAQDNGYYNEAWLKNTTAITNYAKLYSVKRAASGSGPYEFKGNGALLSSGAASNGAVWTLDVGGVTFGQYSKAFVPEVFVYNRDLTPSEIQRLESYMGLKYGITLNNGATDYIASDGTTLFWTASSNSGYAKHITGIGKDDCTLLHQKQSLSADTGTITIALGNSVAVSNATNLNNITNDKSFFVFGDNNGATAFATAIAGTYVTRRMDRVFKVQKTNWADQNITLKVKGAGLNNYLLISAGPAFGTITQELQLSSDGTVTLNTALLTNGVYFTIGAKINGPNNVTAGVALWLRADDGNATGGQWNDFSGNGNGAVQETAAKQAMVMPVAVNFNPALKFDGVNDFLASPSLFTANGTNNIQVYAVAITDNIQVQDLFGEMVANGQHVHAHLPWSDGNIYWDAPYGYRAYGPWGGSLGAPYVWSFLRSPSAMNALRNRTQVAVYNAAMGNIAGSNNPFIVGAVGNGVQPLNGKIAELIVFNNSTATSVTQRQQIESYLALKYGITLNQTPATDYLASDGSVYWSASGNGVYNKHITGIGRDTITALLQKQSVSADTGYITIALGNAIALSNAANAGTITNDKSFFVTSDNGAAKQYTVSVSGLTGVNVALARTWKVQKTNWADQDITLRADTTLTAPQFIIISTDASFGAGDLVLPVTNRSITLNTSQLPNGAFFTFGNGLKGPGGVVTGIGAWYKGDRGLTRDQWNDYSGNGYDIPQTAAGFKPGISANAMNFNPTPTFTPPQYFGKGNIVDPATSILGNNAANTQNYAVFGVSSAGAGAVGGAIFDQMTTNGYPIIAAPSNSNTTMYFDAPYGWRFSAAWGGVIGKPNVWGFIKTQPNVSVYRDRNVLINDNLNRDFSTGSGGNYASNLGVWHGNGYFTGNIPELIVYRNLTALTTTDRLKIESYLAIKYGVTLNLAAAAGYLATDGTNYFDATANAGYLKHITGIGRDSITDLNQKQSVSVDTGVVTIALGNAVALSNTANTAIITNDRSFFVFGDNGAATAYLTPVTGITGITNRMTRIFKVDKTNWADQNITLRLNGGNAQTYLLVSADAIFGAGDAAYVLNADSTVSLNSSNLPDGAYFTFAAPLRGPNNINNGIMVWLRADDGSASGENWKDFSRFGAGGTQPAAANRPATDAKGINFNYAFKFDGVDDFLENQTDSLLTSNNATLIAVVDQLAYTTWGGVMSYNRTGNTERPAITVTDVNNKIGVNHVNISAVQASVNTPAPAFLIRNLFTAPNVSATANGGTLTNAITPSWIGAGTALGYYVGKHNTGANIFNGSISEVIAYNRPLAAAELQQVESYLALKYGLTLNSGATAYLASDASTYWTVDATYKNKITGIGRDDSTALNTKQSVSADTGFVTLSLGSSVTITNEQNTNTITNNRSFFVFADNGLPANNFTVAVSGSAHNVTRRMARVWKVQKTNWADQNITFKITPVGIENHLLISSDPNFATFSQELPVAANGTVTFSSALFTAGDIYFTFGAPLKSPGGVAGHVLWVRADIGTSSVIDNSTVDGWSDMSASSQTFVKGLATNLPLFRNNSINNINFNPVVQFGGAGYSMTASSILKTATYNGAAVFALNSQATTLNASVFNESTANGTSVNLHATWSDNIVYWDAPLTPNRITYNAGNINNQVNLWTATSDVSLASNRQEIFKNGVSMSTGNLTGTITGNNSVPLIGSGYNGRLPELIVYTTPLTAVQRQKVNSYLTLKYGLTMNNGNTSYLATDGSTIWDATANATYKNNIAGIGRDDEEALAQKQSASINTGTQVVIGLGSIDSTNLTNTNNFTADLSYLIWGDNNGLPYFRTAVTGTTLANYRMGKVWKVQETGTVGNVMVAIPTNALANPTASYIIVSSDATFDGTDVFTKLNPVTINNKSYSAVTVDLADGQYFTFANDLKLPGGVVGNTLWMRADFGTSSTTDGTAISDWNDFGADINNATQATVANQPTYTNNASTNINFNPVVKFNGTSQRMVLDGTKLPVGTSARTVIAATGSATIARGLISWGDQNAAGVGTRYAMELGGGQRSIEASNTRYGNVGGNTIIPGITMFTNAANTTTAATQMRVNGAGITNSFICCGTATLNTLSLPTAYLGDNTINGGGSFYNGVLGDIVVYDRTLTATEQQQVESYMALKYGIAMSQTVATNYLATDGNVIWDATANAVYKNSITGIGRDDLEGMNQKQSRNSDTTRLRVAIGLGALAETNIGNANSFAADRSYLIWGDDNAAATFKTVVTGNSNVNYRMTRLWAVQETGTIAQVEVAFPFDALPNPRQSYLVVSADATIDNSDTYIPLYDITINGKKHWAAKTDFTTGQYFTVAAFIKSPGAVGATSLWVRADQGIQNNTDGSAVDVWVDYGNEVNNASQANAALQPLFKNNATDNINYNPVVVFNGTSQYLNLDVTRLPVGTTARTMIGAGALNNITGNRYMISWGTAVASQGMGLANVGGVGDMVGYGNDVITAAGFWQLNMPNELFGTWAGAGGPASLYSKIQSVATPVNKAWNTGTTGARLGNSVWGAEYWSGPITDLIVFDRELTNNERQRVSTYLAIRNGYTINQSTPYSNYLNTNSTVIWNATANAAYGNNIAGIGRDDIEGLNQKQSKSIQTGAIVGIGLGTIATDNAANTSTFVKDTSYLVWGSNSTALTTSTTDLPARFSRRLTQEWKLSLGNFDNQLQPVAMVFNLTGVTYTATATTDFTLLVDSDGDGDFTTGTLQQVTATDFNSGANTVSFDNITNLSTGAVFTLAIGPEALKLTTKVILQGAWNGSAMTTALKTAAVLPATDPYGQGTTVTVSPNATAAQVVDWVLVELRDAANPSAVVASRAGFVLSNGNVVDTTYTQPLSFTGIANGMYKVGIRHRNHLGIMTLNDVDFSTGTATVDFTTNTTATWGTNAQKSLTGGVMGLWAGNVNGDNNIMHSAKPSDASAVATGVLTHAGNTTASPAYPGFINVYNVWDVNLDGKVMYTAAPSDQAIIVNNVKTHPANTFGLTSYIITQQLP